MGIPISFPKMEVGMPTPSLLDGGGGHPHLVRRWSCAPPSLLKWRWACNLLTLLEERSTSPLGGGGGHPHLS